MSDISSELFNTEYLATPEWIHIRLDVYAEYRKISLDEAFLELVDSEYATPLEVPGWWCLNAPQDV